MKKILILSALILSGAATFAQVQTTAATDQASTTTSMKMNVVLNDVRTITLSNQGYNLSLLTTADYLAVASSDGKDFSATTDVSVVSRGGYKVSVTTNGDLVGSNGNTSVIPSSKLRIKVSGVSTSPISNESPTLTTALNSVPTAASPLIIASGAGNAHGTLGTTFPVLCNLGNFTGIVNLPADTYTSTITYTIEAL